METSTAIRGFAIGTNAGKRSNWSRPSVPRQARCAFNKINLGQTTADSRRQMAHGAARTDIQNPITGITFCARATTGHAAAPSRYKFPPLHSITSSARARSVAGMSKSIVLAV